MIVLNIDVTKIPREAIATKPNWKGKFLKLKLVDHPKDDDDGFIAIDQTKEQREAREPSVIVGNWRHVGQTTQSQPRQHPSGRSGGSEERNGRSQATARKPVDPDSDAAEEDDIPF